VTSLFAPQQVHSNTNLQDGGGVGADDDFELSSICDVSGSVRFSTNEKRLADYENDFSEGDDSELELADEMPTENELGNQ